MRGKKDGRKREGDKESRGKGGKGWIVFRKLSIQGIRVKVRNDKRKGPKKRKKRKR